MGDEKQTTAPPQFFDPNDILKEMGIEQGMTLADFGAGNGYITFKAAPLVGHKGLVYALDVKKSVVSHIVAEAKALGALNVKPIWTNLETVGANPIPANSVDIVCVINTLFQSHKHKAIIKEAKRMVKPGGRIMIVDWRKESAPFGPPVDDRVSIEKLKQIGYDEGLNKISEFSPGNYHFGVIFKK